jgi:hypothetical protein
MVRRTLTVLFVSALMASAGGCGVVRALVCEPFGPNRLFDRTHCRDGSCGSCAACVGPVEDESCGPAEGTCADCRGPLIRGRWCPAHRVYGCRVCARSGESCGAPCGESCGESCGAPCGESCGDASCGPRDCWRPGPLTWLFRWMSCGTFCGSGCGPRYWGDWYGDPPDACDPCDRCGNFTGGPQGCSACSRAPGYAAAARPAATCSNCGRSIAKAPARSAQPGVPAHPYTTAPRVISQTDRAVTPAADDETPHLAQPRRVAPR